jgi:hypothetical protein
MAAMRAMATNLITVVDMTYPFRCSIMRYVSVSESLVTSATCSYMKDDRQPEKSQSSTNDRSRTNQDMEKVKLLDDLPMTATEFDRSRGYHHGM